MNKPERAVHARGTSLSAGWALGLPPGWDLRQERGVDRFHYTDPAGRVVRLLPDAARSQIAVPPGWQARPDPRSGRLRFLDTRGASFLFNPLALLAQERESATQPVTRADSRDVTGAKPKPDGEALMDAARAGDLVSAIAIVTNRVMAAEYVAPDGMTPLLVACAAGDTSVAQVLLGAGVMPDACVTPGEGKTALHVAAEGGHRDLALLLLSVAADPDVRARDGSTPLVAACGRGFAGVAEVLVASGASVDMPDAGGATPLHAACERGHLAIARMLIGAGADVGKATATGSTPIVAAAMHGAAGNVEICSVLASRGAEFPAQCVAMARQLLGDVAVEFLSAQAHRAQTLRITKPERKPEATPRVWSALQELLPDVWAGLRWLRVAQGVVPAQGCYYLCSKKIGPFGSEGMPLADIAGATRVPNADAAVSKHIGMFLCQHLRGSAFSGRIAMLELLQNSLAEHCFFQAALRLRCAQTTEDWLDSSATYRLPTADGGNSPDNLINGADAEIRPKIVAARMSLSLKWHSNAANAPWHSAIRCQFPNVTLVPMICPLEAEDALRCAELGFAQLPKEDGPLGKGYYLTTSMSYAQLRSASMLICLVAANKVFPAVESPLEARAKLMGRENVLGYDAHYAVVCSKTTSADTRPRWSLAALGVEDTALQADEFVCFEPTSILPLFLLTTK
eukprot:m51a1_g9053 hypothetical protein (683) ;mRNA; r:43198-45306